MGKIGCIAFIGDSFTFGEGLELYQETPKWVNQRKKNSIWSDLVKIQDDSSIKFRENNRYANLVSKHFNSNTVIDYRNGGCFASLIDLLNPILNLQFDIQQFNLVKNPNIIIIQFSCFDRNPVHFHLKSTEFKCYCDLCNDYSDKNIDKSKHDYFTFGSINQIFQNKNETSSVYQNVKKWVASNFELNFDNIYFSAKEIEKYYTPMHLEYLINEYFIPLNNRNTPIFFIDSWDATSSDAIFKNKYIKDRLIPLIGYDNKFYLKYEEWENTFEHKRIVNEFPNSNNYHPTLLQNKYLAESIIKYLEKNYDSNLI